MLLQAFGGECAAPSGGAADVVDIALTYSKISPKLCYESQLIEEKGK